MPDSIRTTLPVLLLTAILAPTVVAAQTGNNLEGWPDWVIEGMEKEATAQTLRSVETPAENIRTKLPGKTETPQPVDDGWYFISDIEANVPLECYVYTTSLDLATLTTVLAQNNIAAVAAASNGEVGVQRVHFVDANMVDGFPYLALEWIYTVVVDGQPQVGFTKVRAAAKEGMAFACSHNYLGYRETFAQAFDDFVSSAEYEVTTPLPFYEEIARLDFNGFGAGLAYYSFTEDADGDVRMRSTEAALMPVDPSTIMTSDGITITYARPDGTLINSTTVSVENGEISSHLSLERGADNAWISSGTVQGKEISSTIDGALKPASELRMITAVRDLFAGTEESKQLDMWVPAADPTRFLKTTVTRDDSEVERQGIVEFGPLNYVGQFDQYGNIETAVMDMGPLSINIERLWSKGTPEL